jgi:hypothetical protein
MPQHTVPTALALYPVRGVSLAGGAVGEGAVGEGAVGDGAPSPRRSRNPPQPRVPCRAGAPATGIARDRRNPVHRESKPATAVIPAGRTRRATEPHTPEAALVPAPSQHRRSAAHGGPPSRVERNETMMRRRALAKAHAAMAVRKPTPPANRLAPCAAVSRTTKRDADETRSHDTTRLFPRGRSHRVTSSHSERNETLVGRRRARVRLCPATPHAPDRCPTPRDFAPEPHAPFPPPHPPRRAPPATGQNVPAPHAPRAPRTSAPAPPQSAARPLAPARGPSRPARAPRNRAA